MPENITSSHSDMVLLLGRIDGKLDSALQRLERNEKQLGGIEDRVTSLEKGRAWLLGAGAVLSTFITLLLGGAADMITKGH